MYGLHFAAPPATLPAAHWERLARSLHRHHTELEVGKELVHCAYLALFFLGSKHYVHTVLPMLAVSILFLASFDWKRTDG